MSTNDLPKDEPCGFLFSYHRSDPLPWQCLTRYPNHCKNVTFIDVDYEDLMLKKLETVRKNPELSEPLVNLSFPNPGGIILRSNKYTQIGCDLRDIPRLSQLLSEVIDLENSLLLFTAEVSITYMDLESANSLIKWAGTIPEGKAMVLLPTIYKSLFD